MFKNTFSYCCRATAFILLFLSLFIVFISAVPGDVNDDGQVTAVDSCILSRYLAKWSGYDVILSLDNADVDGVDGVSASDSVFLTRHLSGWTGYEELKGSSGTNTDDNFQTAPMLASKETWYKSSTPKSSITEIHILTSYTPEEGAEVWNADVDNTGAVKCYIEGSKLTIAGDGSACIKLSPDASYTFANFTAVTNIYNASLLNTSEATTFSRLFYNCYALKTVDVSRWDTSNVTSLVAMCYNCYALESFNVGRWDTSNVNDMQAAFYMRNGDNKALTTLDVANWNTSKVTSTTHMFQRLNALVSVDVSNWDVSQVTDMAAMFYACTDLVSLDLRKWDVRKVIDMDHMFSDCNSLESILFDTWNAESCTIFDCMFGDCWALKTLDVSGFNTSAGTVFSQMFERNSNLTSIKGLNSFDTSLGDCFTDMFHGCSSLESLDLSSFDTRNATDNMYRPDDPDYLAFRTMLAGMSSLRELKIGENFCFEGDGTISAPFVMPAPLVDGNDGNWYTADGTAYAPEDVPSLTANTYYAVKPFPQVAPMLAPKQTWYKSSTPKSSIKEINILTSYTPGDGAESWIADVDGTGSIMCYIEGSTLTIAGNGSDIIKLSPDASFTFEKFTDVTAINNANLLDTSNVINASKIFNFCHALQTVDVSKFDLSNATSMLAMFQRCESIASLDVSNWNVSKASDMKGLFKDCHALEKLDVSNWNVSSATELNSMFSGCESLSGLDVSEWNLSNATNISFMFWGCSSLGTVDVSNWDVSNVESFDHLFAHSCVSGVDVSKWDTSSATNMYAMFHTVRNTTIDVSSFDTSKVTVFGQMFELMINCTNIYGLENFDTSQGVDFCEMFRNCPNLRELDLSSFDTRNAKDNVAVSSNGGKSLGFKDMMSNGVMHEIKLGANFDFDGAGTAYPFVMPQPRGQGNWYTADGTVYAPEDVLSLTANVYYSVKP